MITAKGLIKIETTKEEEILRLKEKAIPNLLQKVLPKVIIDTLRKKVKQSLPDGKIAILKFNVNIELWEIESNKIEIKAYIEISPKEIEDLLKTDTILLPSINLAPIPPKSLETFKKQQQKFKLN
jgi:hypothetical protein